MTERKEEDWRMTAVICEEYLHLLLWFVVQQPETQIGNRGLQGTANSHKTTT